MVDEPRLLPSLSSDDLPAATWLEIAQSVVLADNPKMRQPIGSGETMLKGGLMIMTSTTRTHLESTIGIGGL